MLSDLAYHPFANYFPLLDDGELDGLAADIARNGLQQAVTLFEGKVLDGRNRLLACKLANVEPRFEQYTGTDPLGFVISANIQRRHLTQSQKAAVAVEILPLLEVEAKKRQQATLKRGNKKPVPENLPERESNGESRDKAGKLLGVSGRLISSAKKIQTESPDKFEAIKSGVNTLHEVENQLRRENIRQRRTEALVKTDGDTLEIHTGDFRESGSIIPDNSVDLIFTDPPYEKKSVELYADLSQFAKRVLRPGGWCLAYCGQTYLPEVMQAMRQHLIYGWCFAIKHAGGWTQIWKLKIQNTWKPILGFYKPPLEAWWNFFRIHSVVARKSKIMNGSRRKVKRHILLKK